MSLLKLYYRDMNSPYKCKKRAMELFNKYAELSEAERYFSAEEIELCKNNFVRNLLDNEKQVYIDYLNQQIEELKPIDDAKNRVFDFGLIAEYEQLINDIERF